MEYYALKSNIGYISINTTISEVDYHSQSYSVDLKIDVSRIAEDVSSIKNIQMSKAVCSTEFHVGEEYRNNICRSIETWNKLLICRSITTETSNLPSSNGQEPEKRQLRELDMSDAGDRRS